MDYCVSHLLQHQPLKIPVKAVCKSQGGGAKKDACCKTLTLCNVDIEQVSTRDQLKRVIRTQLTDDIANH